MRGPPPRQDPGLPRRPFRSQRSTLPLLLPTVLETCSLFSEALSAISFRKSSNPIHDEMLPHCVLRHGCGPPMTSQRKNKETKAVRKGFPPASRWKTSAKSTNQMLCKSPHRCCMLAPVTRSRTYIEHSNNVEEHFCTRLQLTEQIPIFGVYRLLSVWEEDYRPKGQTPQLAECTGDLAPMKSTWKRKG